MQSDDGIFISQKKYVGEILDRFQMKDCNPVSTPVECGTKLHKDLDGQKVDSTLYKQIVGSLIYLTATRPNLMYSVSLISRYMENRTELHLLAAKRILRYLQGTRSLGIYCKKDEKSDLVLFHGHLKSKTKAEFVVATSCACQAIWLRKILEELQFKQIGATTIFCDHSSTIKLSRNPVLHGRSKHIDVRFYFLRDLCKDGTIDMVQCKSEDHVADIFTKA